MLLILLLFEFFTIYRYHYHCRFLSSTKNYSTYHCVPTTSLNLMRSNILAPWVSAGPIAQRADVPEWFLNNSLWMNSGWECRDVFNETQGDPDVLLPRAQAMKCVDCILRDSIFMN